jgi:uroporphyrin-III C-methyltransferase
MLFGRADEELATLKQAGIAVEVVPGITAALAGAASIQQSLTLRGVSRSVAFITLAQATEGAENINPNQPISNPSADTLVYYMGRKDAANIAQQLIAQGKKHTEDTPVQILEAVSTPKERQWENNLGSLAQGKADNWFDSNSPAIIMVGEALRNKQSATTSESQRSGTKIDDGLQDGKILTNGRRRA